VLGGVKKRRNILQTIKRRRANWIAYILHWNCLLQHVIEGKIDGRVEVMGRWGRGCKELQDDLKEKRGYWKLKHEGLNCTVRRHGFERCYEPVIRQTTGWMNEWIKGWCWRSCSSHCKTHHV
jgi:hypothetical protein